MYSCRSIMPCSICLEKFTKTVVIELDCGHVLHEKCLKSLIKSRNRKCPLCKKKNYTKYTFGIIFVSF